MERTIGIKVADGTLYPVLEDGFYGDKRVVLTTIRDNQAEVHIDFYQGDASAGVGGGRYIGSLIIENIEPAAKGAPDIEVVMGASREGNLNVSATDRTTGEEQSLSVSLRGPEEQSEFDVPDFELESPTPPEAPEASVPAAAETGRATASARTEERRIEPEPAPRRRLAPIILFVLLGLVLVAAVAYVVYRTLLSPDESATVTQLVPAPTAVAKASPPPAAKAASSPAPAAATTTANSAQSKVAEPTSALSGSERGVRYRIKWGDTLWDLSSTYYRDPWLYPRIARANNIKNPDLIFAGTTIFVPER